MRAAILAVGSELLGTERLDTNSLRLAEVLERYGVELAAKGVVGDDRGEIAAELGRLLGRFDLVLATGGLGPTADDLTREAAADALGRPLVFHPEIAAWIERRFRDHGVAMPESNRRQAEVIDGAVVVPNPRGTAPGMRIAAGGDGRRDATLFLFPGVPDEMAGMVSSHLEPWLAAATAGRGAREGRVFKVAALPESTVDDRIRGAYAEFGRETITILAHPGEVQLHFWATGGEAERRARLDAVAARLRELVGPAIYTADPAATLEGTVGDLLRGRGESAATAESCTGGLVAERLTRVPGSSDYFLGGAVAYSNRLKESLLGVPGALLAAHGAVSEEVARAMAAGARAAFAADWAIAVTGVAGPGGGSEEKPVGTVHLAVAGPGEDEAAVEHRRVRFPGDRRRVRELSAQLGLEMLRRRLAGLPSTAEEAGSWR
jgi:nicotinamide-nucleotide amidase